MTAGGWFEHRGQGLARTLRSLLLWTCGLLALFVGAAVVFLAVAGDEVPPGDPGTPPIVLNDWTAARLGDGRVS